METIEVRTRRRCEFIDITEHVREAVRAADVTDGVALVFVPHTTAGVTINENADPDVIHDILLTLDRLVPEHQTGYRHAEGNSDAHVKAGLMGSSVSVILQQGRLQLGTWQGIYFCEFDGPRHRKVTIQVS